MNILKKAWVMGGTTLIFSSFSPRPAVAFPHPARPYLQTSEPRETPRLKYYRLELSTCNNCPGFIKANVAGTVTLSNNEFEQMNKALINSIKQYNLKNQSNPDFQIVQDYSVQYAPFIDKKGRKRIWINGFCNDADQRSGTEIATAFDGGNCFFNTTIRVGSTKPTIISIHGFG